MHVCVYPSHHITVFCSESHKLVHEIFLNEMIVDHLYIQMNVTCKFSIGFLQEIYKFCLYNFKLKKFDFFKNANSYNDEIEKIYNVSIVFYKKYTRYTNM